MSLHEMKVIIPQLSSTFNILGSKQTQIRMIIIHYLSNYAILIASETIVDIFAQHCVMSCIITYTIYENQEGVHLTRCDHKKKTKPNPGAVAVFFSVNEEITL